MFHQIIQWYAKHMLYFVDPTYEPAIKNKEFYEFYDQENVEKWLTPEQWDYREELQNEILFYKSRYAKACNERIKKLVKYGPFS